MMHYIENKRIRISVADHGADGRGGLLGGEDRPEGEQDDGDARAG